jgi:inhibitor of KinA
MPTLRPASDRTLLVSFGDQIDEATSERVHRLLSRLDAAPLPGVVDLSPAYASILVRFDPLAVDHEQAASWVQSCLARLEGTPLPPARQVEIPVCYGGEFGPDLEEVARHAGLPADEVVRLHKGREFTVFFLGFTPGFAYMGIVPEAIACPRLARPRPMVPAGSVGIAGSQTGVYPQATPGGWRIVGRTPLAMFDPGRDPMSWLRIADRVRFQPIDEARFRELLA